MARLFAMICKVLAKNKGKIIKYSKDTLRKIRLHIHGKQISIIGPNAAGKTSMLHILRNPKASIDPLNYDKTTDPVLFASKIKIDWTLPCENPNVKPETISLKIRKPKDVGGEISIRDSEDGWIDVCKDSDFLFYIFDAYSYEKNSNMKDRIQSDFVWIADHAQSFKTGFSIIMFANKTDKFEEPTRTKWIQSQIPQIEDIACKSLGAYKFHLKLITPCCLLSNSERINSISQALKYLAEKSNNNSQKSSKVTNDG